MPDASPDSGEMPFDPSHFGRHQFPDGLREELIKAQKPRIDPKFLQDTLPPNRSPVLTETEQPVTTPRGGFAAPKPPVGATDRDAPTLIASPGAKRAPNIHDRDATTQIKIPTAKPLRGTAAADSPSAPPVDTSRTEPTVLLPAKRKNDKRSLVIAVVAALVALLLIAILAAPSGESAPPPTPSPQPAAAPTTPRVNQPATPPEAPPATAAPDAMPTPQPALSQREPTPATAAGSPSAPPKPASVSKSTPAAKPTPVGTKTRPGFDPSKPWEED